MTRRSRARGLPSGVPGERVPAAGTRAGRQPAIPAIGSAPTPRFGGDVPAPVHTPPNLTRGPHCARDWLLRSARL